MIYIGIDPGMNGGIAAINTIGQVLHIDRMPATERDILTSLEAIDAIQHAVRDYGRACVIERAQAMPGQGVVSMFTYGRGYGALLMALTALGIRFDEITSPVWQTVMRCRSKGNKNVTKRRAQQLFPSVKVTHAIADALLIAEFCRRRERGSSGEESKGAAPGREGRQPDRADGGQAGAWRYPQGITQHGGPRAAESDLAGARAASQPAARQPLRRHR